MSRSRRRSLRAAAVLVVSSATVRNVLAQLEEHGYVHQPHTSAGRVPTDRGYRVFVDLLLESRTPAVSPPTSNSSCAEQAVQTPLMDDLLASVSHLVSRAARHVGFALAANPAAVLQRIEFVPLDGSRVLVIVVVARSNQVTQKVVDAGETLRPDDLAQAANYLNTEFAGLPLFDVREAVLAAAPAGAHALRRSCWRARCGWRSRPSRSFPRHRPSTWKVRPRCSRHGRTRASRSATLRALLEMMEEKERMVQLLNAYIDGPGLTVVIGAEHAVAGSAPFQPDCLHRD